MDQAYESDGPVMPFQPYAPFNFRKIMQRQISQSVDHQLDVYAGMSTGKADGRFANSMPATTTLTRNPYDLPYFVVGKSIVGQLTVAAP